MVAVCIEPLFGPPSGQFVPKYAFFFGDEQDYGRGPQMLKKSSKICVTAGMLGVTLMAVPASATHSWNNYHWGRRTAPFTLTLRDNVSAAWDFYLRQAATDWSNSSVLDTVVRAGTVDPRKCRPTSGIVQVCNASYGRNGWLGIAQIWISGSHITQGRAKLNDSYFSMATYNKPAWRALVMCQEIAHTFGLDHQDENHTNTNLGSCMDYSSKPLGPPDNQHPNDHDDDQLAIIYRHLDSNSTIAPSLVASAAPADDWGRAIRFTREGKGRVFVKDLDPTRRVVTFVTWAPE
jgi:hypothetical protein